MLAVALALGASLAFGVADYLGGAAARRLALLTVLLLSQLAGLAGIVVVVGLRGEGPPDTASLAWGALAGLFGAAAITALYHGLAVGLMSVVAPLAATAAVIPVIAGVVIGETPSSVQNGGIAVALLGVILVSRSSSEGSAGRFAAGAGLGLLAALLIGALLTAFETASDQDPYWATLALRTVTATIFLAAALVRRPPLRVSRRALAGLVLIGLLDLAGTTLFAVASTEGLVGIVSVLSSLYPVVTVALARVFLGERLSGVQASGVVAAFGGIALIAIG
jgi:drug/metabolite transporter (DMT)-like permease